MDIFGEALFCLLPPANILSNSLKDNFNLTSIMESYRENRKDVGFEPDRSWLNLGFLPNKL